jgi:hypothetical protein
MKRRQFLIKSAIGLGGAMAVGPSLSTLLRPGTAPFSLDVVTAHPSRVIDAVQSLLESSGLSSQSVRFEEHQLAGSHVSDIAFVRGTSLVDFRRNEDRLSRRIARLAKVLNFPTRVDDPTLLRFSSAQATGGGSEVQVFSGGVLVGRSSLHLNHTTERIENQRGYLELTIENGRAHASAASCTHQTCMRMGPIHRRGESLVCIPNQIRVSVSGRILEGVDGIAS